MIQFFSYPFYEVLGGMFEEFQGHPLKNTILYGGFHAFYHSSGKLLIPSQEFSYNPMTTLYKYINIPSPSNILGTRYWFLSKEEFRKFYRECRITRRVNDKAWNGLLKFDRPGSRNNIILRWKNNVEA
jgi:hypothetical protein